MKQNFTNKVSYKVFKQSGTYLLLFFIVLTFSIFSGPSLMPKMSPDSYGYWSVSQDFTSEISNIRPFFFPFLIRICNYISHDNWNILLSFIQITISEEMVGHKLGEFAPTRTYRGHIRDKKGAKS